MKFLPAKERVELGLHKSKTSGRREKRQVVMEFMMILDGKKISGIQTFIADAWKGMKRVGSAQSLVELNREVESQNVRFYALPKDEDVRGEVVMLAEDVNLFDLRLDKLGNGEIVMYFKFVQPIGKNLWDWLFAAEQAEVVYAEFEECQTELLKDEPKAMTATVQ